LLLLLLLLALALDHAGHAQLLAVNIIDHLLSLNPCIGKHESTDDQQKHSHNQEQDFESLVIVLDRLLLEKYLFF